MGSYLCGKKEFRGLRVIRIREFNVAHLGIWCWRLREEKERLWRRVLAAHYEEVGGRIDKGERLDSRIFRHYLAKGSSFKNHPFLLGVFFITAFLLSIVFCDGVFFRIINSSVQMVVDLMRTSIICLFNVTFLVQFWSLDLQWISYFTGNLNHISNCLIQFGHLGGTTKNQRSSTHLLWLSCVWVIWNKRNCRSRPHVFFFFVFFSLSYSLCFFVFIYLFENEKIHVSLWLCNVTMSHKWYQKLSIKPQIFISTLNSLLMEVFFHGHTRNFLSPTFFFFL